MWIFDIFETYPESLMGSSKLLHPKKNTADKRHEACAQWRSKTYFRRGIIIELREHMDAKPQMM